jgi:potassium channel subfamily K
MCTIGYGDIAPVTPMAKLFSCAFVLIGFGFIDILLSGMVTYFLDKQEALLLSSMATGRHEIAKNYLVDTKKGRMRIRTKVSLAFGVVIMCIGVGTVVMHFLESMGWLDSFYLSCMSVTTVGYGDHAFTTISGRLFASIWLLVSTLAVARSFIFLAEARIDKRHRLIAKLMLEKEMTAGDLVAADFDNDGCVRYPLKKQKK